MARGPVWRRAVLLGRRDGTCMMTNKEAERGPLRLLLQERPECYLALRP